MRNKREKQIYIDGERFIKSKISIVYMINMFNQMENMMSLILSHDQKILLSLIPNKEIQLIKNLYILRVST